jgi:hypothetical protein
MDVALTAIFYASVIGGLLAWIAAIAASGPSARWLSVGAAGLLAVAGVLGMFSIGMVFLVLAIVCLVAASRESRSPAGEEA